MAKAKIADKTKNKIKHSTGQLFNFAQDSYLERTSRPIYAIVFLLPFIIFYELGTFGINTDVLNQSQIRVVAFVWLQNMLESLGFSGKFAWMAPPLAVVVILIALQITFLSSSAGAENNISRFDNNDIQSPVFLLPSCSSTAGNSVSPPAGQTGAIEPGRSLLANIVTGIGAGIYEELVFRLILICVLMNGKD